MIFSLNALIKFPLRKPSLGVRPRLCCTIVDGMMAQTVVQSRTSGSFLLLPGLSGVA